MLRTKLISFFVNLNQEIRSLGQIIHCGFAEINNHFPPGDEMLRDAQNLLLPLSCPFRNIDCFHLLTNWTGEVRKQKQRKIYRIYLCTTVVCCKIPFLNIFKENVPTYWMSGNVSGLRQVELAAKYHGRTTRLPSYLARFTGLIWIGSLACRREMTTRFPGVQRGSLSPCANWLRGTTRTKQCAPSQSLTRSHWVCSWSLSLD